MLTILDIFLSIGLIASNSSLNSIQVSGIDLESPTGLLSQAHVKLRVQERKQPTSKMTTRQHILFTTEMCDDLCNKKSLTWMAVKGRFTGNTTSSGACLLKPGDNPASNGAIGMPSYCSQIDSVVKRRCNRRNMQVVVQKQLTEVLGQRVITP